MSHFIDIVDYYQITYDMNNLTLNDNIRISPIFTQQMFLSAQQNQRIKRFQEVLQEIYKKRGHYKFENYYLTPDQNIYLGSKVLDQFSVFTQSWFQSNSNTTKLNYMYSLYSRIIIRKQISEIKISSTILKNGVPLIVKSKAIRLLIGKFFTKLNSAARDGCFKLNPFSGLMYFDLCSSLTNDQFNLFMLQHKLGLDYIQSQLKTCIQYCRYNFHRVLELIEQNPQDLQKFLLSSRQKFRKFVKDDKHLDHIKKLILNSSFDYQFMYSSQIRKNVVEAQIKSKIQSSRQRFDQNQVVNYNLNNQIQNFRVAKYFRFYNQNKINDHKRQYPINYLTSLTVLKQSQKSFIKNLAYPIMKVSATNQRPAIYSQIFIDFADKPKWELIAQGGFSKIQRAQCKFIYHSYDVNDSIDQISIKRMFQLGFIRKLLIKKVDKTTTVKVMEEKRVINMIKDTFCHNIPKFYSSNQSQYKNSLIMDFFAFKSLDLYKRNSQQTLTLITKIFLLMQTIQGIRFLRDHKIVHLDIKPQNLIIARGLIVKVTDYGQSYHPSVRSPQYKPGYTIPYVAPQIFLQGNIKFNQKLDVFGIGMLMHEILFDFFPLDMRRIGSEKLIAMYKSNQYIYNLLRSPEKTDAYGPRDITNLLCCLCLKCLSKNMQDRPLLDWIQIILKDCILYLDQIY